MITLIHAHPYAHHSKPSQALLNSVRGLPHMNVRQLYEMYPDAFVDEREQLLVGPVAVVRVRLPKQKTNLLKEVL